MTQWIHWQAAAAVTGFAAEIMLTMTTLQGRALRKLLANKKEDYFPACSRLLLHVSICSLLSSTLSFWGVAIVTGSDSKAFRNGEAVSRKSRVALAVVTWLAQNEWTFLSLKGISHHLESDETSSPDGGREHNSNLRCIKNTYKPHYFNWETQTWCKVIYSLQILMHFKVHTLNVWTVRDFNSVKNYNSY